MAQLLTFLGGDRAACAIAAVAMARRLGAEGQRVLWVTPEGSPLGASLWGQPLSPDPTAVAPGVMAVYAQATALLARSWDQVKTLEAQYLRDPLLKQVYREELTILPGMDEALLLNALREWDGSGQYDAIVVAGRDDLSTLRMWGLADSLDWYIRRFQGVIQNSDVARALTPFLQPIASVILASGGNVDRLQEPLGQARQWLAAGREAVQDPRRVLGFLVTPTDAAGVAQGQYLWGCSQQVGITVGGVLSFAGGDSEPGATSAFNPLPVTPLPRFTGQNWDTLTAALPELSGAIAAAPRPLTIDPAQGTVRLFLPGFTKAQISLTQSGPEVTLEAGGYRRNLLLPEPLRQRPITGAKFQDNALTLSF